VKKKRSFLLLEILIALGIVAGASVYLIRNPLLSINQELKALYEIEERRLWRVKLMEIEDTLPSAAATLSESKKVQYLPMTMCLPGGNTRKYKKPYYFYCMEKAEGNDSTMYYKVRVEEAFSVKDKPATDAKRRKNVADGVYEYFVAVPKN